MKVIDEVMVAARSVEQVIETLVFAAAAIVVAGGTIAMCLPGVLGLS